MMSISDGSKTNSARRWTIVKMYKAIRDRIGKFHRLRKVWYANDFDHQVYFETTRFSS